MKIMLDEGARVPERAHETDAGLDLFANESVAIPSGTWKAIDTGVHVQLPEGTAGFVKSKSGLMTKNGILTDGTIDEGYTGAIKVCLFNNSFTTFYVEKGDKVAQLVIMSVRKPSIEIVDVLEKTERGDNGFGSTGK